MQKSVWVGLNTILMRTAGLFDWSIKYQDGTRPSSWDPKDYDPEKMKWWA